MTKIEMIEAIINKNFTDEVIAEILAILIEDEKLIIIEEYDDFFIIEATNE